MLLQKTEAEKVEAVVSWFFLFGFVERFLNVDETAVKVMIVSSRGNKTCVINTHF